MKPLKQELWDKYIAPFIKEMDRLNSKEVKGFIKDNTVHGKPLESHIMYRVNLGTDDSPTFLLDVKDRMYKYEFLIEFDTDDAGYGIYYGCRAVADPSLSEEEMIEQIKLISEDWQNIKEETKTLLNNMFPNKKFGDRTFRLTNNAEDNTFWPFWIALGDEEDILDVAVKATKLIANIYVKRYAQNANSNIINNLMLEELNLPFSKKLTNGKLQTFIKKAEKKGYLIKDDLYIGDIYRLNKEIPEELSEIMKVSKKRGPEIGANLLAFIMRYLGVEVNEYLQYILGKDGDKLNKNTLKTLKKTTYKIEDLQKKLEEFFA